MQCTQAEICAFFDISEKTLQSWCKKTYNDGFSQVFAKKRGLGKISLRRMQWQLAERNASMAIFLGKQFLGQTDKVEQSVIDVTKINELNASVLDNIAPTRAIEDFEE